MKQWAVLLIVTVCAACQTQVTSTVAPTQTIIVEVATSVAPRVPTPTPDCLPVSDVSIDVQRTDGGIIKLKAIGLEPGEKPFIFYSAQNSREGKRIEAYNFAQGADSQGVFTYTLEELQTLKGDTSTTWDVRIVHIRGVACVEITVP